MPPIKSRLMSIVGASQSRMRGLSDAVPPNDPAGAAFAPKTIWALGVPPTLQAPLGTGMPEFAFRFIPTNQPLAERKARIIASERPCIATWGEADAPDLDSFVRENNVLRGTIGPAPLLAQQVNHSWSLIPYGYTLDVIGATTRRQAGAAAAPKPEERRALELYVARGRSEANFGRRGALAHRPSRRALLIVGDPPTPVAPRSPARFDAYRSMVKEARDRYPGWEVVFVTNGDHELPPELIQDIRVFCDVVIHAPYDPSMLERYELVMAHKSWAAFDALARNQRAHVYAPSPLADVAPGSDALVGIFAERYLNRVSYIDPVTSRIIDFQTALELISARCAELPGPQHTIPPGWSGPLPGSEDVAALLRTTDRPFNRDAIIEGRQSPPDPATVLATLQIPAWVMPDEALPPVGESKVLYLRSDMASAPAELAAFCDGWQALDIDSEPQRNGSVSRVNTFARRQPDLFARLMARRIARAGVTHAVVSDIDSRATRAFARACGRAGVVRIYVPPAPFGDGSEWGATPPLGMCGMLADVVLAWDASHRDRIVAAGFPADRILSTALLAERPAQTTREQLIAVSLSQPWPTDDPETAGTIDDFVTALVALAEAFGYQIRFHFGGEAVVSLSEKAINRILLAENGDYEVEGAEMTPFATSLASASVLITDRPAIFNRARLAGISALMVDHRPSTGASVISTITRIRTAVSSWLDTMPEVPPPEPLLDALPIRAVLTDIMTGRLHITSLGTPKAIVMEGRTLPLNLITSSVAPEVLEQTERYELAMLGAQHWIRSTSMTPLEDLADVDLFVQWGIRENNTRALINAYRQRLGADLLILEDGFIRSINIGLSGTPTLSLVMDDMTAFYDATRPSRVETILNSSYKPSEAELERARAAMKLITDNKVTKYNFAPYLRMDIGRPGRKKVLVVDQREGDQSITSGLASPQSFHQMAMAALELTPEYDVIVKTHPDANIGGKGSAIGGSMIDFMRRNPAVTIVTADMNPYSLLDIVDKVFVVTSGLGLEALLAGREVSCFGVPFYAGWGVTNDHISIPRRTAKRTVEEIFHIFYIKLSRYFDPENQRVCEVEDLTRHIASIRPWTMPGTEEDKPQSALADAPLRQIEEPRESHLPGVPADATIWLMGVKRPDRRAFQKVFTGWEVRAAGEGATIDQASIAIRQSATPVIIACDATMPGVRAFGRRWSIPVFTLNELKLELPAELQHYLPGNGMTD